MERKMLVKPGKFINDPAFLNNGRTRGVKLVGLYAGTAENSVRHSSILQRFTAELCRMPY